MYRLSFTLYSRAHFAFLVSKSNNCDVIIKCETPVDRGAAKNANYSFKASKT